jgi:hypothetical protein
VVYAVMRLLTYEPGPRADLLVPAFKLFYKYFVGEIASAKGARFKLTFELGPRTSGLRSGSLTFSSRVRADLSQYVMNCKSKQQCPCCWGFYDIDERSNRPLFGVSDSYSFMNVMLSAPYAGRLALCPMTEARTWLDSVCFDMVKRMVLTGSKSSIILVRGPLHLRAVKKVPSEIQLIEVE